MYVVVAVGVTDTLPEVAPPVWKFVPVQTAALTEDHEIVAALLGTAVTFDIIDADELAFTVTVAVAGVVAPPASHATE